MGMDQQYPDCAMAMEFGGFSLGHLHGFFLCGAGTLANRCLGSGRILCDSRGIWYMDGRALLPIGHYLLRAMLQLHHHSQ